ncbi:hypothetical protein ANCDUO_03805 [Ancylostoma duodenale]|uniref:Uncharacterized protein n=1 Tax=Ancylostoma duodenale TaxID=51022 RepID=A0A0C2H8N1_9BILA|nr:hypothetical protein ANCDUO_03805 [Ancylostoma duodenale]
MRLSDKCWTRAASDWAPRDVKRTTGRPPTGWSDFFTKSFKEKYDALCVPRTDGIGQLWLARATDKWKIAGTRSVYPTINGSRGYRDLFRAACH